MKNILRLTCAFLTVSFLFACHARGEDPDAALYADSKTWPNISGNKLDLKSDAKPADQFMAAQKIAYIKGLYEGLMAEEMIGNKRSKLLPKLPGYAPEEIAGELDDFYSDFDNEDIPVINSLIIINEKNRGAPKSKLKKLIDDSKDANLNVDRLF